MASKDRAAALVEELQIVRDALLDLIERIPADRWSRVDAPGQWSPGKDAEHVADGNALHQWVVRSALHLKRGRRPAVERCSAVARVSQPEVVTLVRERARESARLIESLTDEQLDVPCRPPRSVEQFVKRVLIGHFESHRAEIERKLRRS